MVTGEERLLNILIKERMRTAIDAVLGTDSVYQRALAEQDTAFSEVEKIGLSKEQSAVVDGAISAVNFCGASYGAVAYRQGLKDGIRLVSELREIV